MLISGKIMISAAQVVDKIGYSDLIHGVNLYYSNSKRGFVLRIYGSNHLCEYVLDKKSDKFVLYSKRPS